MALVDHRGNPIETSQLTQELAPSVTGVRTHWHDSVASGLTPESLAMVIQSVDDENDIQDFLTLAEEMEMRDLHYASVLGTRKNAISGLKMVCEAVSDDDKAVEQKEFIDGLIADDPFRVLVRSLLDALGKGFSVCEIMWDRTGSQWVPMDYIHRDPRFFQFDILTGSEIRLRDEQDMANGIPLEPYKFSTHKPEIKTGIPIRGGLARLAVVAYMCKGYGVRDWMSFAEVFGMPLRVGKYDDDATTDQKSALLNAVASIGADAACIIPESTMIEFVESNKATGGERLYEGLVNWLDDQVSKGVLGQTASTQGTPGKLGSDEEQALVRQDIKEHDASQLAASLRRDIVKPAIDLNFGPQPRGGYPILRFDFGDKENLDELATSLAPFIDRGLKVQSSLILDKFGLDTAEEGSEILQPKGAVRSAGVAVPDDLVPVEPPAPAQPSNDDLEEALQREKKLLLVDIARKARGGEELTVAQRTLLVAELARTGDHKDAIDDMAERELKQWRRMLDPVFKPVMELANASQNYDEFLAKLDGVLGDMDSTVIAKRLAVSSFKMRGLGDGSDDVT